MEMNPRGWSRCTEVLESSGNYKLNIERFKDVLSSIQ